MFRSSYEITKISLVDFDTKLFEKSYSYPIRFLTKELVFVKESDIERRNKLVENS